MTGDPFVFRDGIPDDYDDDDGGDYDDLLPGEKWCPVCSCYHAGECF